MSETLQLDALEARILGVLIEKELTTPEQYPLTLNGATLGANQKSNRDPVLELVESDVYGALQKLIRKSLVGSVHPAGGRVEKFRHNGEAILQVSKAEIAVLAELLLRGPQQPGELRGRATRMTPIDSLEQLSRILNALIQRKLVVRLSPPPGSRAEYYAQTLAPTAHTVDWRAAPAAMSASASTSARPQAPMNPAPATYPAPAPRLPVPPPTVDVAALEERMKEAYEKRIAELEQVTSKLRRQLDALAWKLNQKLDP